VSGQITVTDKEDGATELMHTYCGTGEFMAPELFHSEKGRTLNYDKTIDIFSLGVLYMALLEAPPKCKLKAMQGGALRV
jgi:serine/threonine protein kinase